MDKTGQSKSYFNATAGIDEDSVIHPCFGNESLKETPINVDTLCRESKELALG